MSQDFQQIGQASSALERVAAERQGWLDQRDTGDETLGHEMTDASDFSFRDRRAHMQAMSWEAGPGSFTLPTPMESHEEPSMAAIDVTAVARDDEGTFSADTGAGTLPPYGGTR